MSKKSWQVGKWIAISAALHFLAAHFSTGYHHPDEHFQILEFANSKLGGTPVETLPWEFAARLRPWFQPALVAMILKVLRVIGLTNPFAEAEALRFLHGALGFAALWTLWRTLREQGWLTAPAARYAAVATAGLWFLPYLNVRTSSESLSGSLLLLGTAAILRFSKTRAAVAGLLLGLAFEARFQTAVATLGLLALVYLGPTSNSQATLTSHRARLKFLPLTLLGLALAFAVGRCADAWGYGEWTWTPWNYFRVNLLEGKAAEWGTKPAWAYFGMIAQTLPPLSLAVIASYLWLWIRRPLHPLTALSLPFVLLHCAIGHKETRFLFPIAGLTPFVLALAWNHLPPLSARASFWLHRVVLPLALAVNVAGLCVLTFRPIRHELLVMEWFQKKFPNGATFASVGDATFSAAGGLPIYFYRPPGTVEHVHKDWTELTAAEKAGETVRYVFVPRPALWEDAQAWKLRCFPLYNGLPRWLEAAPEALQRKVPRALFLDCGPPLQ